eukprot:5687923-Amphidinium_carterae.1
MHKQREEWTQWYAQYCNWYSKQGQTAAPGTSHANGKEEEKPKGLGAAGPITPTFRRKSQMRPRVPNN